MKIYLYLVKSATSNPVMIRIAYRNKILSEDQVFPEVYSGYENVVDIDRSVQGLRTKMRLE